MDIFNLVGSVFKPAMDGLDNLFTSDEERLKAKNELTQLQNKLTVAFMEHEQKTISAQKDIIIAEANNESWLTRNWRPLVMLCLTGCIMAHWLGFTPENLTPSAVDGLLDIVQVGLGGYVVGRSAEKVAKEYANSKKN